MPYVSKIFEFKSTTITITIIQYCNHIITRKTNDQMIHICHIYRTSLPASPFQNLSIYLVLFVLQVAHKASTRARQRCRSAETRSRRPHVQPFSFISLSTVLLQVSLGWPLFLWPSGVHRRAILVKAVVCWRSTCPIHRQRLRLTFTINHPKSWGKLMLHLNNSVIAHAVAFSQASHLD